MTDITPWRRKRGDDRWVEEDIDDWQGQSRWSVVDRERVGRARSTSGAHDDSGVIPDATSFLLLPTQSQAEVRWDKDVIVIVLCDAETSFVHLDRKIEATFETRQSPNANQSWHDDMPNMHDLERKYSGYLGLCVATKHKMSSFPLVRSFEYVVCPESSRA